MDNPIIDFNETNKLQIRFNDVDIVGHVNNVIFQHYYDLGRLRYFENVLKDDVNWNEESLAIVKISTEYLKPVYLEDKIFVQTKIIRIGNKSIEMAQRIVSNIDNNISIHSFSTSILSGFHKKLKTSIEIPSKWKENIIAFEGDMKQ